MHECLVALGSNLGNRTAYLERAVAEIGESPQVRALRRSGWYATPPIGGPGVQREFLNGAVRFETSLSPSQILHLLRRVEHQLNRQREIRWGDRTIDLDLLLYGHVVRGTANLTLPHPRMTYRGFVLVPAVEVAADMIHPTTGWTVRQLFDNLARRPHHVALTGPIGVGKTALLDSVAQSRSLHLVRDTIDEAALAQYYAAPSDQAWEMEYRLLNERSCALRHSSLTDEGRIILSDFCWDQSLAFASLWMRDEDLVRLESEWIACRAGVLIPTLVILLYAPVPVLLERIRRRGRSYERHLTSDWLASLMGALRNLASRAEAGPVIELDVTSPQIADEVSAALQSIQTALPTFPQLYRVNSE